MGFADKVKPGGFAGAAPSPLAAKGKVGNVLARPGRPFAKHKKRGNISRLISAQLGGPQAGGSVLG